MHHCNGHSMKAEKTAHSLLLTLMGQRGRILPFCAISFNSNLQDQTLMTQIDKHMGAEIFLVCPPFEE